MKEKILFLLKDTGAWYVEAINHVDSGVSESNLLEVIQEEMSQFFDIVNNREFDEIKKRYSNSRVIMYKVSEKIMEFDNMRDRVTNNFNFKFFLSQI